MTHDFTGKSIKCDTWEQMQHLAKLAEEQGCKPDRFKLSDFLNGAIFFEVWEDNDYSNFYEPSIEGNKSITYSDFIYPTEVVEVTGCGDCPLHAFRGESERNYCSFESKYETDNPLFTTCPLKQKSITIKLKS
jgi:hypothetical protein